MATYEKATVDGTLLYVNIATPSKKYESEELEWKLSVCVDKATAKAWNKQFAKQKAKEIDNDEFSEKYKVHVPYPSQDEQYVINISQNCKTSEGKELRQPKVFQDIGANNVINITNTKLVGNGSKGTVSYTIVDNKYGTFAKLDALLVTELIEYIKKDDNPFGKTVVEGEVVTREGIGGAVVDTDDDENLPF